MPSNISIEQKKQIILKFMDTRANRTKICASMQYPLKMRNKVLIPGSTVHLSDEDDQPVWTDFSGPMQTAMLAEARGRGANLIGLIGTDDTDHAVAFAKMDAESDVLVGTVMYLKEIQEVLACPAMDLPRLAGVIGMRDLDWPRHVLEHRMSSVELSYISGTQQGDHTMCNSTAMRIEYDDQADGVIVKVNAALEAAGLGTYFLPDNKEHDGFMLYTLTREDGTPV